MKRLLRALLLAGTFTFTGMGTSRADTPPSIWDRAKDPTAEATFRAHVEVRALLREVATMQKQLEMQRELRFQIYEPLIARHCSRALQLLEAQGGENSKDVRIRLDLGELYFEQKNFLRSAEVLKKALADAPNHSASEEGWLTLAFACGHLGDHTCEKKAYVEVLHRVSEEVLRATPTLNLAETDMHLGNLKEAIEGYRDALRISGRTMHRETAPLAVWGLAVALDRSGDRASAEKEARFALELEESMGRPQILHSTGVFFVPAYEIHYYDGLGAFARGKVAKSAAEAAKYFGRAESAFGRYARSADGSDRWLEMAKSRLAASKTEREKAEARALREPPPKLPDDSDVSL